MDKLATIIVRALHSEVVALESDTSDLNSTKELLAVRRDVLAQEIEQHNKAIASCQSELESIDNNIAEHDRTVIDNQKLLDGLSKEIDKYTGKQDADVSAEEIVP